MTYLPSIDVDLFDDGVLASPYETYARMRDLGAAVRVSKYDLVALPRYREVRSALANWRAFSSGSGVGVSPRLNQYYEGSVLASDPPAHDRLRKALMGKLSPPALKALGGDIEAKAEALVARLVAKASFDAVTDLAQVFPISIVADLIGLPDDERDKLLERADGSFNAFGPENHRALDTEYVFADTFRYITTYGARDRLAPGGFGMALYKAADAGTIDPEQVFPLMLAYLFAGMDTTVNAIGHAIWLLATHPDQWRRLREDPRLTAAVFDETLRLESPAQYFTRVAMADCIVGDHSIAQGERVLIMFGSANRDERQWERPELFDLSRRASNHLAFGIGIHACVGQTLARMEADAILKALIKRVEHLAAGTPVRHLNNVLRGLASLPIEVAPVRQAFHRA